MWINQWWYGVVDGVEMWMVCNSGVVDGGME